ncbi:glutamate-5-semialdehyde dehydrogenase [Sphingobacterium wenxiniae]|uniref:Gamma-glutamyl phosphate reductase n=1 Tax=Sphingobacterium wenxiniae TaxID=683125 RepID=A0A1I6T9K2_9SPHI|nr:glutamate-5-semialdehyde dehydrogenase [Sphingobacterium wenxiniae]SFS85870.1 glutamate-5-semialdehyde dehydrogenase [Sphingobacterium wenxiniae]
MQTLENQLRYAQKATGALKRLSDKDKQDVLEIFADTLAVNVDTILAENMKDLQRMDPKDARYDRLLLNRERILALAQSVRDVALLTDPTNVLLSSKTLPNGLLVEKKTVALGVVGVIYESRPNVTVDVAALCIRSGNVCVLRGGSDAWFTNTVLVQLIQEVLERQSLDVHIVQLLPTDRALVAELLTATKYVDIIIPRGSQALIDFVRENAKVPVIETGAGVCHTYVEATADLDKAAKIVANAKISRPSVCNALDTVLLDRAIAADLLTKLMPYFNEAEVKVFADADSYSILEQVEYPYLAQADAEDFGREFLSLQCSLKVVDSFEEALEHIARYSSKHSECIVTEDAEKAAIFMDTVDAAAVYVNASTRFTDGGEFGLGAEIGISTQKLHARGPFALEKLVTEKWFVTGNGQVR